MTWAMGGKGVVGIDFEATFGTTPASPAGKKMPINKSNIAGKQAVNNPSTITGSRNPVAPSFGNIDVNGSLEVPVTVRDFGWWLRACFGAPVTTGATAPYTHVFKIGDTMPSLVIEQGFTDVAQYFLYNGCKIGKLGLSFGGDGELVASIDVMGAKETLATTSFDTTLTTMVFDRFANFQAAILEGGSAIANCTEAGIDVEFGLDGNTYCIGGSGFRSDIAEGIVAASGNIKAMFQNATLLTKAMNGTESSLKITLTNGSHSLEILIPELVYERATPGIEGPAGVFVTLPFKGYYQNGADASVIKVTLINDVASYA